MPIPFGSARFLRALRHRDYAIYSAGSTVTMIGLWMQRIAVGWVTWELTHSPSWLGAVAFAELFPVVIISPIAGTAADRFNRLWLGRIMQIAMMVQAAMLAYLSLAGELTIWWLLWLSIFNGIAVSFWQPARLTLIPNLVPREDLSSAIALNSVIFNMARFIGPGLAGVVIASYGAGWAFVANAASYTTFIVALFMIRPSDDRETRARKSFISDITEGYRYAATHPGIAPSLVLMAASCIAIRGVFELYPGFADHVFERGAEGLSILAASTGVGAMIAGIWVGGRGSDGLAKVSVWAVAVQVVAVTVFAASPWFWLAVASVAVLGGSVTVHGAATQTLVQGSVAGHMRGRVMALYGMMFRGGPAIGALSMGWAAETVGLSWPAIGGAAMALAIFVWSRQRLPAMRKAFEPAGG